MGKPTGFMEYERVGNEAKNSKERIKCFNEFHTPMEEDERKKQGARCMECGVPFCQSGMMIGGMASGCPLNNLIPEWNDLLYRGNLEQALARLLKTNNFPEFTSRVCPSPCEAACTCGINCAPISIKENENFIIENGYEKGHLKANPPKVRTGKKVAIVGSGPSGLAAADQLNKRGHAVTVFERSDRVGGLLMYGIPNMKLEKHIIERRIELMKEEGVIFVTNADVGNTYKVSKLKKEFDSIILCCGASNPRDINASGRDAGGIYFAVDFLGAVTKSLLDEKAVDDNYIPADFLNGKGVALKGDGFVSVKGKDVLVIGGGDTGNDCVGTSIRLGCNSVTQLEMMPMPPKERTASNPWPEWPRVLKTDYGQEEAIAVFGNDPRIYQTTVKEFVKNKDGNVEKAVCVKLESKKDEETGRFGMVEVPGSEYEIPCQLVLIAAGFLGNQDYVAKAFGVELNERTNVKTAPGQYATNVKNIFTAGDMHRGQSLVVWAIREGREAAKAVDMYLMGYTNL